MNAEEVEYLDFDVCTVRGQKMYLAMFAQRVVADGLQTFHIDRICHTDSIRHVPYGVDAAIPDDVVNINIIADERLSVIVNVDDADQSVTLLSEIIEE